MHAAAIARTAPAPARPAPPAAGIAAGAVVSSAVPAAGRLQHGVLSYLALFSSVGTLVCCALPALLVLFGFGATVASLLSAAPWLVTVSRHKEWVFALAGIMIASSLYYVYRIAPRLLVARGTCSAGDENACRNATRMSRVILWLSTSLLAIGFVVAYLLPVVLERLDS